MYTRGTASAGMVLGSSRIPRRLAALLAGDAVTIIYGVSQIIEILVTDPLRWNIY
jgi:hypothetical protein